MKHPESDLHRAFCKRIKRLYPNDKFVRHEREGKRVGIMLQIHADTHSDCDKLPDFEALIRNDTYSGFYIEFKKPGEKWLLRDGKTVKPAYAEQYKTHQHIKTLGRAVWFSNDIEHATGLYIAFKENRTEQMQEYLLPESDHDRAERDAEVFFKQFEV